MNSPRVLVAPDKFKGSLDAEGVVAAITAGIARTRPAARVIPLPMADGGEGTVKAALTVGFQRVDVEVSGPMSSPVRAHYARLQDVAVIEMAAASGLSLTRPDAKSARWASSFGTGELIADALDGGAQTIVLSVGGSASTDGGVGMLAALGGRFHDTGNDPLWRGGAALTRLGGIDLSGLDPRLADIDLVLASDVDNPLLGQAGSAAVYGPQKGADEAIVEELELGLSRLVNALTRTHPYARRLAGSPGAGAAGGVGFAALLVGARQRPGIEVMLDLTGFREHLREAALVITGEGSLDQQSLRGKVPVGVAAAAAQAGVPTVAIAGQCSLSQPVLREHGIEAGYALTDIEPDGEVCMRQASRLIAEIAAGIALARLN
ncbi:MAG: glycerate kinase [Beutenbergiaceae bacterium]